MELKEKIIDLCNKHDNINAKALFRKTSRLLKIVLVDNETDLDKISELVPIGIDTIERYTKENTIIETFLTKEEYEVFKNKIKYIFDLNKKQTKNRELKTLLNIIDDIFNSRYTLDDICIKNFLSPSRFSKILLDENYLDERFGKGVREKVKEKLHQNSLIRNRAKRDDYIIEDKVHILLVKPGILYLNSIDYKKLMLAASYLASEANVNYMTQKYNSSFSAIISFISDKRLSEILKEEYYSKLNKFINVEKLIFENNIVEKQKYLMQIVQFLRENDYDKYLALKYFDLPVNLFDRLLNETIKLTITNDEDKSEIKKLLQNEEKNKQM